MTTISIEIYTISNEIVLITMQAIELPLYPTIEPIPKSSPVFHPHQSINNALSAIFPEHEEESKVIRTRKILGETAKTLSDERIECIVTEFQYLIDTWLNEFEKDIFNGKTLQEVLKRKEYASSK